MNPAVLCGMMLLGLASCAATQPEPSSRFDGYYAGSRVSDRPDACGIVKRQGKTAATVRNGQVGLDLFGPRTHMAGTVGGDGTLRASGIWANPTGGFPGVTVLHGTIAGTALDGSASDLRCHTEIHLRRTAPARTQRNDVIPKPRGLL